MRENPLYRYEQVMRFITDLVDAGTLVPGSRAPSLRQISAQQRTVSPPRCRPIGSWKTAEYSKPGRSPASMWRRAAHLP